MLFNNPSPALKDWVSPLFYTSSVPQAICKGRQLVVYNEAFLQLLGSPKMKEIESRPIEWLSPLFQPDGSLSAETYRSIMEQARKKGSLRFDWFLKPEGHRQLQLEITMDHFRVKGQDYFLTSYFDIGQMLDELILQQEGILSGVN